MRSSLLALIGPLCLGACVPASSQPPANEQSMDPQMLKVWKKEFYDFAAALMLLNNKDPVEQARGLDRAAAMAPYQYFDDDQKLVTKARQGDAAARAELARRGEVLDAVQIYFRPYDKVRWEAARRRILAKGDDMAAYLSMILVSSLLLGKYQDVYGEIRIELVAIGEEARKLVVGVLAEKSRRARDLPIGSWEDITQLGAALLCFGEKSLLDFQAMVESPKRWVRVSAAKAVSEAWRHVGSPLRQHVEFRGGAADLVGRKLLRDSDWEVRASAADALGDLRAGEHSCRPLLEALATERDERMFVQQRIILALGRANCIEAIPKLVNCLDVPNIDVAERAQEALYAITGERRNGRAQWVSWYREKYPEWLKRHQQQPK